MGDAIRPDHYGGRNNPYEAIKVIGAWSAEGDWDGTTGFNLGNTLKYISRKGRKDPTKSIEDLEKAVEYLTLQIGYERSRIVDTDHSSFDDIL